MCLEKKKGQIRENCTKKKLFVGLCCSRRTSIQYGTAKNIKTFGSYKFLSVFTKSPVLPFKGPFM